MPNFPPVPPSLRAIGHYLKIAAEHETRDPIVSYWSRFHAVQQGLTLDKSSAEAKALLFSLMDWLEARKKEMGDNEGITNDAVAEAHIENYALKIFNWADTQDRASVFNKNVVKAFYTAGVLIDVLTNFNKELSEDFVKARKYAKWKAAYIHNCLKNGEIPQSGPIDGEDDTESSTLNINMANLATNTTNDLPFTNNIPSPNNMNRTNNFNYGEISSGSNSNYVEFGSQNAPTLQNIDGGGGGVAYDSTTSNYTSGNVSLSIADIAKAQKYCKWAGSSLDYDDVPTAINNLEKALTLLKTGKDE